MIIQPVDGVDQPSGVNPPVRVLRPRGRTPIGCLLWIHGGGLIVGSAAHDDAFCAETAREVGVVVVSVDYRLAPEHPFPSALDDCAGGWDWIQANAGHLGIDPTRVAVGGHSAGGGIAATLIQRLYDAGARPCARWLFCPMLDDRTAGRRDLDRTRHLAWNNRNNRAAWRYYLGAEPGRAHLPTYASAARRSDLTGLAPAWLGVGDVDLFHDEVVRYARRLHGCGVPTRCDVVTGAPHDFDQWAAGTTAARRYVTVARGWLARQIRTTR